VSRNISGDRNVIPEFAELFFPSEIPVRREKMKELSEKEKQKKKIFSLHFRHKQNIYLIIGILLLINKFFKYFVIFGSLG
jgi:hypothetical protein